MVLLLVVLRYAIVVHFICGSVRTKFADNWTIFKKYTMKTDGSKFADPSMATDSQQIRFESGLTTLTLLQR